MPPLIRTSFNAFRDVEKRLKYRFWDKERERSNHARLLAEAGPTGRRCLLRHERIAWSGPPHDKIRAYVCLDCHAAASEPEIRDRGFTFEEIPDWEIKRILDLDLERMVKQKTSIYVPSAP